MLQKEKMGIMGERGGKRDGKWKSREDVGGERAEEGGDVTQVLYIDCLVSLASKALGIAATLRPSEACPLTPYYS